MSPDERVFARHAQRDSSNLLAHPVQKLLVRRLRVISVVPEGRDGPCGEMPFVSHQRYRATTRALTLFALPYKTFWVTCEGIQERG